MRRTITAGLITLAAISTLGLAPTASAEESSRVGTTHDGGQDRFWIYSNTSYTGLYKSYNGTDRYFNNDVWDGYGASVDDLTSSAKNDTNRTARLFQYGNGSGGLCSGLQVTFYSGTHIRDLSNYNFDNKASCIVFL